MNFRAAFRSVACALALAAFSAGAFAQTFPTKPVTLMFGLPPAFLDVVARVMQPVMQQELGQPVVFDFRPGAGGTLAADILARTNPDGYTIMFAEHAAVMYMQHLRKLPYDPYKDLAIVSSIYVAPFLIIAGPSAKSANLRELIAEAKANPGKITYGHSGNGTMHHLTMELFQKRAGIKLLAVPFSGGAASRTAAIAGTVDITITGEDVSKPLIAAGKVKPVAATSETRLVSVPDTPTIGEVIPGFAALSGGSFFAPVATPRPVMLKLNSAVTRALRDPEIAKKLDGMGAVPTPRSLEESDRYWRTEGEVWAALIKGSNLKADE